MNNNTAEITTSVVTVTHQPLRRAAPNRRKPKNRPRTLADQLGLDLAHFLMDSGMDEMCWPLRKHYEKYFYSELVEIHTREVVCTPVGPYCAEIIRKTNLEFFFHVVVEYYMSSINRWAPITFRAYLNTMMNFSHQLALEVSRRRAAAAASAADVPPVFAAALLLAERLRHLASEHMHLSVK